MPKTVTIALDLYDRHMPFFRRQLAVPQEFDLVAREVGMVPPRRDGIDRHGRMLKGEEFDAAEVSLSSYIIAKSKGAPFTAIPVFPRRLLSPNHIFVREDSSCQSPADLGGKRVMIWAFQTTMSVLAKGDFKRDFGVDWRHIRWLTSHPEEIEVTGLPITQLKPGADPIAMLHSGEADALIHPHPPAPALSNRDGIRRLFRDPPSECRRYVKTHGYCPIMHLLAIKNSLVDENPEFSRVLMKLWDEAKSIADGYYHDPAYAMPILAQQQYQQQKNDLGDNLWASGLKANRKNLEHFIDDMVDQKLLDEAISIEALFHPSTHGT